MRQSAAAHPRSFADGVSDRRRRSRRRHGELRRRDVSLGRERHACDVPARRRRPVTPPSSSGVSSPTQAEARELRSILGVAGRPSPMLRRGGTELRGVLFLGPGRRRRHEPRRHARRSTAVLRLADLVRSASASPPQWIDLHDLAKRTDSDRRSSRSEATRRVGRLRVARRQSERRSVDDLVRGGDARRRRGGADVAHSGSSTTTKTTVARRRRCATGSTVPPSPWRTATTPCSDRRPR